MKDAHQAVKEAIWMALPGPFGEVADALATAALRALSEQGYAVVPVEPTREMLHAAAKAMSPGNKPDEWVSNSVKHAIRWRAMLDAAGGAN